MRYLETWRSSSGDLAPGWRGLHGTRSPAAAPDAMVRRVTLQLGQHKEKLGAIAREEQPRRSAVVIVGQGDSLGIAMTLGKKAASHGSPSSGTETMT